VQEEQHEITHNRAQEREELTALYEAKGFHGKLLEDCIDVLMADSDRLLRVMLQEEMGFRLEENEHPLIQGLGAGIGALFATLISCMGFYFFDMTGIFWATMATIVIAAIASSHTDHNRTVSAIVWNVGLVLVTYATCFYFMLYLTT